MLFDYCFEHLHERERELKADPVLGPLEGSLWPVSGNPAWWLLRCVGHMEVWLFPVAGFASAHGEENVSVGSVSMMQLKEITGDRMPKDGHFTSASHLVLWVLVNSMLIYLLKMDFIK